MSYTREQLYDLVNNSETFDDLVEAVTKVAETYNGKVPGSHKDFDLDKQLRSIQIIRSSDITDFRILTRSFGIRQQSMYLKHYGER